MVKRRPPRSVAFTSTIENLSSGATRNTAQGGFLEVEGIEQLQVVDAAVAFEMQQGVDEACQQAFVALLAKDHLENEVVAQGIDLSIDGRLHGVMNLPSCFERSATIKGPHNAIAQHPPPGKKYFAN